MDEFRKPYEYTEEKRGLILLFIIMLITIDMYQAVFYITPVHEFLKKTPALGNVFMAVSVLYLLFVVFTAITCYKLSKNFVILSKIYLIIRIVFMSCCIIFLFLNNVKGKTMIGFGSKYDTVAEYAFSGLIAPLTLVLVFSAGWFLYFVKSKRCKELVNNQA